ncbi:MAG: hypothetical protein RSB61_04025, partial [Clostridia bacterium]
VAGIVHKPSAKTTAQENEKTNSEPQIFEKANDKQKDCETQNVEPQENEKTNGEPQESEKSNCEKTNDNSKAQDCGTQNETTL